MDEILESGVEVVSNQVQACKLTDLPKGAVFFEANFLSFH